MSLIQSAKLNGHEPYAYIRDVLERLPAQPARRISELLPHTNGSHGSATSAGPRPSRPQPWPTRLAQLQMAETGTRY
ncbi:transposase domain-containing protein [Variovorax sp. Varisp41]|uniref:transposase domain-containing protein n=1 Tax=Variovorax sp. Varisp41 TaxID=3243033 RepID=UPI0039B3A1CB